MQVETVDVSTQESNKKKNALSVLALKTAALLNWNLEIFEQKCHCICKNALLIALLHETLEELSSPTTHGTLDTGPLLPYQLFKCCFVSSLALRALVQAMLPAKPFKVSNVPIPGQQDPTHESHEVQEGILSVLERGGDVSVRILEQLLGAGEVRAPVLSTFTVHTHHTTTITHSWERCKSVADEQFKCQVGFNVGCYHFLPGENMKMHNSHFSEACKLLPELGSHAEYCQMNESKLRGYYKSCASLCSQSTPLEQRSLYDRFLYSLGNEYQVKTLNTVRNVIEGDLWNSNFPVGLAQGGKPGVQFLVQVLAAKFSKLTNSHKERIRLFLMTLNLTSNIKEVLIPAIKMCPPLKALFSQEELLAMWPQHEETRQCAAKTSNAAFTGIVDSDSEMELYGNETKYLKIPYIFDVLGVYLHPKPPGPDLSSACLINQAVAASGQKCEGKLQEQH
nr:LOW QUALITY PROTEIN: uncharacterized protein LOC128689966 [Cherax quadricarinatus]